MPKATAFPRGTTHDDYFEWVRRFPLRPIRSRAEYDQAGAILTELVGRADDPGLSSGEGDYADALGHFLGAYDREHFPIDSKLTPLEALKYLMEQTGMKTSDLGHLLGSGPGHASLILNGKCQLSKANIRILADRFKVSTDLFL